MLEGIFASIIRERQELKQAGYRIDTRKVDEIGRIDIYQKSDYSETGLLVKDGEMKLVNTGKHYYTVAETGDREKFRKMHVIDINNECVYFAEFPYQRRTRVYKGKIIAKGKKEGENNFMFLIDKYVICEEEKYQTTRHYYCWKNTFADYDGWEKWEDLNLDDLQKILLDKLIKNEKKV
ncbi:MAG: hypothetical protein WC848_02150 [Parcubacteria group bacterium]